MGLLSTCQAERFYPKHVIWNGITNLTFGDWLRQNTLFSNDSDVAWQAARSQRRAQPRPVNPQATDAKQTWGEIAPSGNNPLRADTPKNHLR